MVCVACVENGKGLGGKKKAGLLVTRKLRKKIAFSVVLLKVIGIGPVHDSRISAASS